MQFFPQELWKKLLIISAYIIIGILFLYFLLKYLLLYALPFIISFLVALFTRSIYIKLIHLKFPKKLSAVIITAVVYIGIGGIAVFIIRAVSVQLYEVVDQIAKDPQTIIEPFTQIAELIENRYPKVYTLIQNTKIADKLTEKAGTIAIELGEKTAYLASKLPDILFFIFVTLLSTYYFIIVFDKIIFFLRNKIPLTASCMFLALKRHFIKCSKRYVISMVIMLLITFIQLVVGFYILNIPYALSLALLISLIDMLPVLGVGTVLIPWSAVSLVTGNIKKAAGLIVIYLIITLVRQIAEPKIYGESMGMSPFMTLIAMYMGYVFIGIAGLIIAPLLLSVIMSIFNEAVNLLYGGEGKQC